MKPDLYLHIMIWLFALYSLEETLSNMYYFNIDITLLDNNNIDCQI